MIRQVYRLCAAACAEMVWRVPALEPAFVGVGARTWGAPRLGRFYRSAAYRLVDRLRTADARFRRVVVGDQPLVLDVTFNKMAPHPLPAYNKILTAGFSARGSLKRSDFRASRPTSMRWPRRLPPGLKNSPLRQSHL